MSGETSKLAHRRAQLLKLRKVLEEEQAAFTDAVFRDLRRAAGTTLFAELSICLTEIDYVLENLEEWSKPVYVEKTLTTLLDTPMIVKEPKGVVLLISPWNYPLSMVFLPLIPIIAAGWFWHFKHSASANRCPIQETRSSSSRPKCPPIPRTQSTKSSQRLSTRYTSPFRAILSI